MALERRNFTVELRSQEDPLVEGYAAVFDQRSRPISGAWGDKFFEEIQRGAFMRSLQDSAHDIFALWSHDETRPLASRSAGNLSLIENDNGLYFSMRIDPTISWGSDALTAIRTKLVNGMSFGFNVRADQWKKIDGQPVRTLTDIDLYEISPVALPAYGGTTVEARSLTDSYQRFLTNDERALTEVRTKAVARFAFARARHNARRLA